MALRAAIAFAVLSVEPAISAVVVKTSGPAHAVR